METVILCCRFRSFAVGHNGRDIPDQPQVRGFGPDGQLLLDAGLCPDEDIRHGVRRHRNTFCVLAVRRVLHPRAAVHRVPVAGDRRQDPPGNPGHTARQKRVYQPSQDDQSMMLTSRRYMIFFFYKRDWYYIIFFIQLKPLYIKKKQSA